MFVLNVEPVFDFVEFVEQAFSNSLLATITQVGVDGVNDGERNLLGESVGSCMSVIMFEVPVVLAFVDTLVKVSATITE